jgi:hypothetical protein
MADKAMTVSGAHASAESMTIPEREEPQRPNLGEYELRRWPWRRRVTPLETLLAEEWEGEGTEENPYKVNWITNDPENPQVRIKYCLTVYIAQLTGRMNAFLDLGREL